jgi:DNA-directed RNA polymerase sigma subunit (sigma70/sigma32)
MSDDKRKPMEATRKDFHSVLAALTPQQAKALRARFGIDTPGRTPDEEEGALRALARELAMLKRKKK